MSDGKCEVIAPFVLADGTGFRCQYDLNHEGEHSWKKYMKQFQIFGGITMEEVEMRAAQGSIAAKVILANSRKDPEK